MYDRRMGGFFMAFATVVVRAMPDKPEYTLDLDGSDPRRQKTGPVQDATRNSQVTGKRFASWTAAALRRFSSLKD